MMYQALINGKRPVIMGVLNVTPDSFSDGGCYLHQDAAVGQALQMVAEGADILDIGGESTRPGSDPVDAGTQISRVLPVIRRLREVLPPHCLLSIDTTRSQVAEAAVTEGVNIVNDVSGGCDDPEMLGLLGALNLPVILMHRQGASSKTMQDNPVYADVIGEIKTFLLAQVSKAEAKGIASHNIILDPGIGFGKRREDNLAIMASLDEFVTLGYPILLGTSRKRFMGAICQEEDPKQLLGATVATTVMGVMQGVRIFRVHDVKPNRQAADITAHIFRHTAL